MKERLAIIVVDDEVIVLAALRRELRGAYGGRFLVEAAMGADEADLVIEELFIDGIRPFLVISDWLMPGRRGDEFLAAVKARHPSVRCILITGRGDPATIGEAMTRIPLDAALPKPWDRRTLIEAIDASFARFEAEGESDSSAAT
jgi:DNA-binding NtrC family response regulator